MLLLSPWPRFTPQQSGSKSTVSYKASLEGDQEEN